MEAEFDEAEGRSEEAAAASADGDELDGEGKLDRFGAERINELAAKTQPSVEGVVSVLENR